MQSLKKCSLIALTILLCSLPVWSQSKKSSGWRFPTNRMKGVYLETKAGNRKLAYTSYELGEGYSAGHIDWFKDDRVMIVFPSSLDKSIAEYAEQHPEETNQDFRGDEGKRDYDNILSAILLYKVYKVPEIDRRGRRPPFYLGASYSNGYEEHLFGIGKGVVAYVGLAFDRKSAMVWIKRSRSKR